MNVCMRVCMHVHINIQIDRLYIYIYVYTHTHTHIYIDTQVGGATEGLFVYIQELMPDEIKKKHVHIALTHIHTYRHTHIHTGWWRY
jgi:hypothetical protein